MNYEIALARHNDSDLTESTFYCDICDIIVVIEGQEKV
jgi:hypothetical protein